MDARRLDALAARFAPALRRAVEGKRDRYVRTSRSFRPEALARDGKAKAEALEKVAARLSDAGQRQIRGWGDRLAGLARLGETLSYKSTLARGYAVVRGDGHVVTTTSGARQAQALEIEFADGRLAVGGKSSAPRRKPKDEVPPEQGSLL